MDVPTEHSEDTHSTPKLHSPGDWGKVTAQEGLAGVYGVGEVFLGKGQASVRPGSEGKCSKKDVKG